MRIWSDSIDPATIPDEVLRAERARRNAAKRTTFSGGRAGGRPKSVNVCDRCGATIEGRRAFMAHKRAHSAAGALGALGGAVKVKKGIGTLSPEDRIERARAGAAAMWAKRRAKEKATK